MFGGPWSRLAPGDFFPPRSTTVGLGLVTSEMLSPQLPESPSWPQSQELGFWGKQRRA